MSETQVESGTLIMKKLKRYMLDREIILFNNYLIILEQPLNLKQQELDENICLINRELDKMAENNQKRREFIELQVNSDQIKGFTNLLRQSFVTSLYSFMELRILQECHIDSKLRDGGESYDNIPKEYSGIDKAKYYYQKVLISDFPFRTSPDWKWILNLKRLRNCIIHRQGSLTGFSDY
jgi:hypothetical protein